MPLGSVERDSDETDGDAPFVSFGMKKNCQYPHCGYARYPCYVALILRMLADCQSVISDVRWYKRIKCRHVL